MSKPVPFIVRPHASRIWPTVAVTLVAIALAILTIAAAPYLPAELMAVQELQSSGASAAHGSLPHRDREFNRGGGRKLDHPASAFFE